MIINIFYFCIILSVLKVVIAEDHISAIIALISSFMLSSILLLFLECEFLALVFIIIYIGAISVLFLFVLMMLESKISDLSLNKFHLPLGIVFGLLLFIVVISKIDSIIQSNPCCNTLYLYKSKNWFYLIESIEDIAIYSQVLYTYFVLQFLISGMLLLLVLVGVSHLSNNKSKKNSKTIFFKQLSRTAIFF